MADITISGTASPYASQSYSAGSNDKNTLTITSYIQLLAAQLQNQDMTDPMSNSEMMSQMTQMAMVQSLSAMTESIETSTVVNTTTYAAGLMGKEVTIGLTADGAGGTTVMTGVKYGVISSVDFTGSDPMIRLEGDDAHTYSLSQVLGIGRLDDPFEDSTEDEEEEDELDSEAVSELLDALDDDGDEDVKNAADVLLDALDEAEENEKAEAEQELAEQASGTGQEEKNTQTEQET